MTDEQKRIEETIRLVLDQKTPATREGYILAVARYEEWCGQKLATHAAGLRPEGVAEFCAWMRGRKGRWDLPLTEEYVRAVVARLRRLWAILSGDPDTGVRHNVWASWAAPHGASGRNPRHPSDALTADEVKAFFGACRHVSTGDRDRVLLALLFGAGLRSIEARRLQHRDVFVRPGSGELWLRLRGTKNGDTAEQVLPAWVAEILTEWIAERKSQGDGDDHYIVPPAARKFDPQAPTYDGSRHLCRTRIREIFMRLCEAAGTDRRIRSHWGRATVVTTLLEKGVRREDVQQFVRHRSPVMTDVYDRRRQKQSRTVANFIEYE